MHATSPHASSHDARTFLDTRVRAVHGRVVDGLLAAAGHADALLSVPVALDAAVPAARLAVCRLDARQPVAAVGLLPRGDFGYLSRFRRVHVDWFVGQQRQTTRGEGGGETDGRRQL